MSDLRLEVGKIYPTKNGKEVQITYKYNNEDFSPVRGFPFVGYESGTEQKFYYSSAGTLPTVYTIDTDEYIFGFDLVGSTRSHDEKTDPQPIILIKDNELYRADNGSSVIIYKTQSALPYGETFCFMGFSTKFDLPIYYSSDGRAHSHELQQAGFDLVAKIDVPVEPNKESVINVDTDDHDFQINIDSNDHPFKLSVKHHGKLSSVILVPMDGKLYVKIDG